LLPNFFTYESEWKEMTPSLQEAISLARTGNKERARALLIQIIQQEPNNEAAWLWLVDCLSNDTQRIEALERFLQLSPDSERANKALALLRSRQESFPAPPPQENIFFPPEPKRPEVYYPTTGDIDPGFLQEMVDQAEPLSEPPEPESAQADAPAAYAPFSYEAPLPPEKTFDPPQQPASPSDTTNHAEPPREPLQEFAEESRSASGVRWLAIIALLILVIIVVIAGSLLGLFSPQNTRLLPGLAANTKDASDSLTDLATLSPLSYSATRTAGPQATHQALTQPTITLTPRPALPTLLAGAPAGVSFTQSVELPNMRSQHTTTLLKDGKVLLAGGISSALASSRNYLFDPSTQEFEIIDGLTEARFGHSAVLTANGLVLVVGGKNEQGDAKTAETYDPAKKSWSVTRPFYQHGTGHMAVALNNGLVMVAGGCTSSGPTDAAELYNPNNNSWIRISPLPDKRCGGTAIMLKNDNRLLIIGGTQNAEDPSVLIYDILDETWTPAASMKQARSFHTATQLVDRRVIVTGGLSLDGEALATVEIYDPVKNTWEDLPFMSQARYGHSAVFAPDTRLVIIGGLQKTKDNPAPIYLDSAEVYFGGNNMWSEPVKLDSPLANFATVNLPDGNTLISGGTSDGTNELYTTLLLEYTNAR
jgi:N-acetylneuraminic acid mutarotase